MKPAIERIELSIEELEGLLERAQAAAGRGLPEVESGIGIEPGIQAPHDAAHERISCRQVLLARKQECHVDSTPAKIASSIAGRPSFVPGIFMKTLGRPARAYRSLASRSVLAVS